VPDLSIGRIGDMNHAYALAVGLDKQGLGAAWAEVLKGRVVAMTTIAGSGDYGDAGDGGPATKAEFQKPIGLARDPAGMVYVVDEGTNTVRRFTPGGTIGAFAGSGRPAFEGDGGPASAASLNWPRAAAFGPDGSLFVADTLNQRIRRVDGQTGFVTTFAGAPEVVNGVAVNDFAGDGGPATAARLAGVRGMAFGPDGTLYVADTWSTGDKSWNHIRRIKPDGMIDTIVGVDGRHGFNGDGKPGRETQVDFVNQLQVDAKGNVWFADTRNHRVRRWDAATGTVTTVAGTGTDGQAGDGGPATQAQLSSPYGLALVPKSDPPVFFIGERGSRRIRVVGADGKIRTLAGGGEKTVDGEARAMALNEPVALLLEPNGNLVIADSRGAKVRRLWLEWGY
jgi:sugar lactone lactonase YvrE